MVGFIEEGFFEVDIEEVKYMMLSVKWLLCVLFYVKIFFLLWLIFLLILVVCFFLDSFLNKILVDIIEFVFCF